MMTRWQHFLAQLQEIALGLDGTLNACAGLVSFAWSCITRQPLPKVHRAEETISAHLYRRREEGTHWGRIFAPLVDWVFSIWQRDAAGQVVRDHCHQAYRKEMARVYLPDEYRTASTDPTKGPVP
jgi:hypothetical protein